MPLLLAITGAMIEAQRENQPDEDWVPWLVPALKSGHGEQPALTQPKPHRCL